MATITSVPRNNISQLLNRPVATNKSTKSSQSEFISSFAQRYSQANANFDTLNKILSSAISTLADSARDVLKSLS